MGKLGHEEVPFVYGSGDDVPALREDLNRSIRKLNDLLRDITIEINAVTPNENLIAATPTGMDASTDADEESSNVIDSYIEFAWTGQGEGINFVLVYQKSGATEWEQVRVQSATGTITVRIGRLSTDVLYNWKVKAVQMDGEESDWCTAQEITTWGPDVPLGTDIEVSASSTAGTVLVSWNKPSGVTNVKGWRVYRNTTNDFSTATLLGADPDITGSTTCGTATLSYVDTEVVSGQTYYYWITVMDLWDVESVESSAAASLVFYTSVKSLTFQQIGDTEVPSTDGTLAFSTATIVLDNCDDYTDFATTSTISGAIVLSQQTTSIKEGTGALKAEIYTYPKRVSYEGGTASTFIGSAEHAYKCQGFIAASAFTCCALGFKVKRTGTNMSHLTYLLYSDAVIASRPLTVLASATVLSSLVSTTYGTAPNDYIYGQLNQPVNLVLDTRYWCGMSAQGATLANYYTAPRSTANAYGTADECIVYADDGIRWSTYSTQDMNFRVCATGDAPEKYIYSTIAAQDISSKTHIKSYVKTTLGSGTSIHNFAFGESNINEQSGAFDITNIGTWELPEWDISGITSTARDEVTKVGWQLGPLGAGYAYDDIIYLDYLFSNVANPTLKFRYADGYLVPLFPAAPSPFWQSVLYDDFLSVINDTTNELLYGQATWAYNGTVTVAAGDNGIVRIAGDGVVIPTLNPANQVNLLPYATDKNFINEMNVAQYGAAAGTRRFGFSTSTLTTERNEVVGWRHTNAGNYTAYCRTGGVETTIDSGIAAANGVYHILRLEATPGGVEFFVDGTSIGTITTNITTSALMFSTGHSVITASNGYFIDYVLITQNRT